MLAFDLDSTPYEITKVLHILAAMAGLGVTFWYGVYGARAKKAGEHGDAMGSAAIGEANVFVSHAANYVIYAIPILGLGLVFMSKPEQSDDLLWALDQTWVWLSLVLYGIGVTIALTVLDPTAKRLAELSRELASMGAPPAGATGPPPQVAQMDALGKRLGAFSGVSHLIVITILYLMVAKPGL